LTIVLTGGGSGGHITPLLAVATELKRTQPTARLIYIGQTGDGLGDIPAKHPAIDEVFTIRAGKLRRYHGEGLKQLLDLPTMFKNMRDVFYLLIGLYQSYKLLRLLQPDVIFIKGGFVGVPVGLAAAKLKLPYITHDSDAIPGLANRLIARWAVVHAVALPADVYSYPPAKTVTTGIPLQADFVPVSPPLQAKYRGQLKIPATANVMFVIGGGLGSQRVNQAVAEAVPHLLRQFKNLQVLQSVGRGNQAAAEAYYADHLSSAEQQRLQLHEYIDDVWRYSGAADLVITRAGATNLAEFALQGKACIVIPSPFLAGGHQLKNAEYLAEQGAAVVLDEAALTDDPLRLARQASELLQDAAQRQQLATNLADFAKPDATHDLAQLILKQAQL
jgi:UDP-N-acetylglucosamine--N-acetylmuramyl-(pentapeptide) pyrophosphoryl-undecaprenol N-acetylglucosamine transferase